MSEISLTFKLALSILLGCALSLQSQPSAKDPCLSRPLNKPEKPIPLTAELVAKIHENYQTTLGGWKGEIDSDVEVKTRYESCIKECFGVSLYSDSCVTFDFDNLSGASIFKILNARLKDTDPKDFPTQFPVLEQIKQNLQKCLSPSFNLPSLKNLDSNQMTFRVSFMHLNEGFEELKEGEFVQNLSFTSTTTAFESVQRYMKNNKHLLVFSQGALELSDVPIIGKQIEECSLLPEDKEFLLSSGQCWVVERVIDYDIAHNDYSMRCVAGQKVTQDSGTIDQLIQTNCKKFGGGRILDSIKRKGRILMQEIKPQNVEVSKGYTTGNIPETFRSKRIFLKPFDCGKIPAETKFAANI
jgi:hypothetical protein